MTNPDHCDRQRRNRDAITRTVKLGFRKAFPNQNIADMILLAVELATPIVQQTAMLANLHILH